MRDQDIHPTSRRIYRAGLWWTIAYLALVMVFVQLDAIFSFTSPSGFADSMAGILAPIATAWGVMTARSPD